jgi:hypothetical protein
VAQRAGAVGDGRVEYAAVMVVHVVLGHAVQQNIHVRADVHVAELQRAGEGEYQRDVLLLRQPLANDLDVRRGAGGQAARERRIVVDVELEQVEEGVGDEGDGAIDLALDAVVELQRLSGLVAGREGDPLQLVVGQFDVFAGVTRILELASGFISSLTSFCCNSRASVHALHMDGRAIMIRRQRRVGGRKGCQAANQRCGDGKEHGDGGGSL